MTILLIIGIGLVAFGALVLMLFPDRPGGKIAWQGAEVSSVGAGLPLIVVGVLAVAVSGTGAFRDDGGSDQTGGRTTPTGVAVGTTTGAAGGCPDDVLASVPPRRIATVRPGTQDQIVIQPSEPKAEPFGLRFDDGGIVGAIRLTYVHENMLFTIGSVVDAECRKVEQVSNVDWPGRDPFVGVPNYSSLRIDLLERSYLLNLQGGGDIRVDFDPYEPRR